jgi:hypothetical protein
VVSGFSRTEAPRATVEIVRDGRILAHAETRLPAAEATGRIEHIAQVPLEQLPSGRYILRLVVSGAQGQQLREAAFQLIE